MLMGDGLHTRFGHNDVSTMVKYEARTDGDRDQCVLPAGATRNGRIANRKQRNALAGQSHTRGSPRRVWRDRPKWLTAN